MNKFFDPQSVAVIGASATPGRGGYSLVGNLKIAFTGNIYPVNPKYPEIEGIKCYPSVSALPEPADLAVVFVPSAAVPGVLEECGARGMTRVMIQSAGFAETGDGGRRLQDRCLNIAREHGIRLWGPNCMGIVRGHTQFVASFMTPTIWPGKLRPGGVSLIVQSGMLAAGFLIQVLSQGYFGLASACSIGNRMDVNECDIIEHLAHDNETEVLGLYLESVSDPVRFRRAVESFGRPIVLLKGGTSDAGARAAQSHTASLAGNSRVSEGYFRQLGIHRAHGFIEMMDLLKAMNLWQGKKGGRRIAVLTFSGAGGIVTSDHLVRAGLELADLSPQTIEKLKTVFPDWMPPANPLDVWPAIERHGRDKVYRVCLEALADDPNVDGVHVHLFADPFVLEKDPDYLEPLGHNSKPAAVWLIGNVDLFRPLRERVERIGIPVFNEVERGVQALKMMASRPNA